jgi:hypothetical protein
MKHNSSDSPTSGPVPIKALDTEAIVNKPLMAAMVNLELAADRDPLVNDDGS